MNSVWPIGKTRVTCVAVALLLSSVAMANTKNVPMKYQAPAYGMAGCGPVSLVFTSEEERNDIVLQMMASILHINLSYSTYPSAVTSGTSNCGDSSAAFSEALKLERETYIAMNLSELNKQSAQGEGLHLRGLADMFGCGQEPQFKHFALTAQQEHAEIFADHTGSGVANRLLKKLWENDPLKDCLNIK